MQAMHAPKAAKEQRPLRDAPIALLEHTELLFSVVDRLDPRSTLYLTATCKHSLDALPHRPLLNVGGGEFPEVAESDALRIVRSSVYRKLRFVGWKIKLQHQSLDRELRGTLGQLRYAESVERVMDASELAECPLLHRISCASEVASWKANFQRPRVTDVSALGACPALHTLNLRECSGVRDVSALGACPALHTLDLTYCEGVSDVSALAACPALHTLNLRGCSGVSDVSSLGACPALHTLNLSCCWGVSDVSALGACPALHTLDLTECDGVSDVSALLAAIPGLELKGK
jgi:hypothetical protein